MPFVLHPSDRQKYLHCQLPKVGARCMRVDAVVNQSPPSSKEAKVQKLGGDAAMVCTAVLCKSSPDAIEFECCQEARREEARQKKSSSSNPYRSLAYVLAHEMDG